MQLVVEPFDPERGIKAVILTDNRLHYSCVLRGTMPLEHLRRKGLAKYAHYQFSEDDPDLLRDLHEADVLVMFSLADPRWYNFIQYARQNLGKAVVADFDDDVWDVCPFNYAYESLGRHEVAVNLQKRDGTVEKRMFWMDGHAKFYSPANAWLTNRIADMARICTAVSVSNPRLQSHFYEVNPFVEVLGNCVDLDIWQTHKAQRKDGKFRIGWQGGDSHRRDWMKVAPQIGHFLREHADTTLVICGTILTEMMEHLPAEQVEFHPWVNSEAYPYAMMTQGLDLGLAILDDTRFNRRKTALKWMEYSAMAVPTLASAVAPYTDEVRHGEDGWLVPATEWYDALCRAYRSRVELQAVGIRARHRMERDYDIKKRCMDWYEFYRRLKGGETRRTLDAVCLGGLGGQNMRMKWWK